MKDKVVITAAISGAAPTRGANPAVPHTAEEYVAEAKRAEEAGAAVVHVHFRDPNTGAPTTDPAIMQEVVQGIRENTKVLLNLSTGVYPEAPLEMRRRPDRAAHAGHRLAQSRHHELLPGQPPRRHDRL